MVSFGLELTTPIYYYKLETTLHRVFNSIDLKQGGRFYGAQYQQLNKEQRNGILINGSPVVEIDYSGMHMRMLYHLSSLQYEGDPYSFVGDNKELRKIYKLAGLILINAKNITEAKRGFNDELRKRLPIRGFTKVKSYLEFLGFSQPSDVFENLMKHHEPISHHFNTGSGIGLTLQNYDSLIADKVLYHFTKRNIPCLCVHDSFIVPKTHAEDLKSIMIQSYQAILNFTPILK